MTAKNNEIKKEEETEPNYENDIYNNIYVCQDKMIKLM